MDESASNNEQDKLNVTNNLGRSSIVDRGLGSVEGDVSTFEGPVAETTVQIGFRSAITDSNGHFLFEGVPSGRTKLRVASPSNRFYSFDQDILVRPHETISVPVLLPEVTGSVEGRVTDNHGEPIWGAEVVGEFRFRQAPHVSKTDNQGHYSFSAVPKGSYFVRARGGGFMTEGITVSVNGGKTVVANFELQPGHLSINGIITDSSGAPLDCDIYLIRKGIVVAETKLTSNSDSHYQFADLISGQYQIAISTHGHYAICWQGELIDNGVLNFKMDPFDEFKQGS